jgi:hypothetical protein
MFAEGQYLKSDWVRLSCLLQTMPEFMKLFDFRAYVPYSCAVYVNHIQQTLDVHI